jgi:hypothetical protein
MMITGRISLKSNVIYEIDKQFSAYLEIKKILCKEEMKNLYRNIQPFRLQGSVFSMKGPQAAKNKLYMFKDSNGTDGGWYAITKTTDNVL